MAAKLRAQPCPNTACGWRYEGFHICLNQSKVLMTRIEDGRNYVSQTSNREVLPEKASRPSPVADARRAAAATREADRAERDAKIIKMYDEDKLNMDAIAADLNLAYGTVRNALHRAQDRGDLTIRSSGEARRRTVSV